MGDDGRAGKELQMIERMHKLMLRGAWSIVLAVVMMRIGMVELQCHQRESGAVFDFMGKPLRLKIPYARIRHENDEHRERDGFSE